MSAPPNLEATIPLDPTTANLDEVLDRLRAHLTAAECCVSDAVAALHRQHASYLLAVLDCAASTYGRLPRAWRR